MSACGYVRGQFSSYLDGVMTGKDMQLVAAHLNRCDGCSDDFQQWRKTQELLSQLGPAKAPADLALRLRVAISQERAKTPKRDFARFQLLGKHDCARVAAGVRRFCQHSAAARFGGFACRHVRPAGTRGSSRRAPRPGLGSSLPLHRGTGPQRQDRRTR